MSTRLLLIDDDEALRDSLQLMLGAEGYETLCAANAEAALEWIAKLAFDVVLCDLRMPGMNGMALLPEVVRRLPDSTVVMMSSSGTKELAIEALQRGAYDYLAKPFQPAELLLTLRKARERERLRVRTALLERDVQRAVGERPIVAASPPMIELLEMIERAAAHETTVLLTGESGTGKEVLARAVHAQSPRRGEAFVAVDCGAIPDSLFESELFGHSRGAVTGADRARRGLFVEANGGTLFLDEIGELPLALQLDLLRVLQDEEVRPVGESKSRPIDVRVLAATARDLEAMVADGSFREDLYYRLSVMPLRVPPLRERPQDVPLLVDHFFARSCAKLGRSLRGIGSEAMARLVAYHWPGNVRELANVIERAVLLTDSDPITLRSLPDDVRAPARAGSGDGERRLALKPARKRFEAGLIREALAATQGNRTHAARLLEISHRALLYKIKEYGLGEG